MASNSSDFRFRKTDTIGAASAEEDTEFLAACFVETDDYQAVKDTGDIRQIVLGRTGAGKSALFERMKQDLNDRVISIEPQELALAYVSNSTVIKYFTDLGVNLDPFYKLLWRHVLTVELLRTHFEPHVSKEGGPFWQLLIERFKESTRRDKSARQAIQYLQQWGEQFWLETEYRVREITSRLERDLSREAGVALKSGALNTELSAARRSRLSEEEKADVVQRGQRIVSEAQIQDLSNVFDVLERVLTDRQKNYYMLIDRLDENWVEDKLRYRLIMALIDTIREMSRIANIKVLVSIRRDLIDRVFRLVREAGAGFQEEKYQSLYLPLLWSPDQIIEILDRRIAVLVARRYDKRKPVSHADLMPRQIDKVPIRQFITDRAQRPREVISLFNKCIEESAGKLRLSVDTLRRAEGEYSRQRLRALGDEWHADYPGLLDFVGILKKRSASFQIGTISLEDVTELCLMSTIDNSTDAGMLRSGAKQVCDGIVSVDEFRRMLFIVFYRIGLVGLKLETFEKASWADELGQGVSPSEIDDTTRVLVHTTYRRGLGIRGR